MARLYRIPTRLIVLTMLPAALFLAWAFLSTGWSEFPALTVRRAARLTIETSGFTLLALTFRSQREFLSALFWTFFVILLLDITSIAVPSRSFSQGSFEGIHLFKNEAGMFLFAALFVFALVAAQSTSWLRLLAAGALFVGIVLLALTKAKSAIGCCALALLLAALTRTLVMPRSYGKIIAAACWVLTIVVVALIVYDLGTDVVLAGLFGDATLTGRDQLWRYVALKSYSVPMQGVGYGALWMVGTDAEANLKAAGAKWLALQAHNGYVDISGQVGYVGLCLLLVFLILCFVRLLRFAALQSGRLSPQLSDYGMYIYWGLIIYNLTETSFFRPGALWSLLVFVTSFASGQVLTNSVWAASKTPLFARKHRYQT